MSLTALFSDYENDICEGLLPIKSVILVSISTKPPLSLIIIFETTLSTAFCHSTLVGKNFMCKVDQSGKLLAIEVHVSKFN